MRRRRKPSDEEQPEDPLYEVEEIITDKSFKIYEDDTNGKAHEMPEVDDIPDLDLYLNAEVLLPQDGDHMSATKVIGKISDRYNNPIGTYDSNPILNSRVYVVMFPDSSVQQYGANIIAENLCSQVDEEGRQYMLIDEILDHTSDDISVRKEEGIRMDGNEGSTQLKAGTSWLAGRMELNRGFH